MTKVRFHGPVAGFSGAMGEMVFADSEEKNRTVAYMKKHYPPTQAQLDVQTRFANAASRAQAALTDPMTHAFYAEIAKEKGLSAQVVALTDILVAPTILPLELSNYKGNIGDTIQIMARDDIGLADMDVTLTAIDGTKIEEGKAVENGVRTGIWSYTATKAVAMGSDIFIKVVGVDHAGNKAQITENPTVGVDQ